MTSVLTRGGPVPIRSLQGGGLGSRGWGEVQVLIGELGAIDGLATGAVHVGEVTALSPRRTTRQLHVLRDDRLRAVRAARAHTVGYTGGWDQEQGEIESPGLHVGEVTALP